MFGGQPAPATPCKLVGKRRRRSGDRRNYASKAWAKGSLAATLRQAKPRRRRVSAGQWTGPKRACRASLAGQGLAEPGPGRGADERDGRVARDLYDSGAIGKEPQKDAHAALDEAVIAAYGFAAKEGLLAQILALNAAVAPRAAAGEPVVGPGVPAGYPTPATLISAPAIGR